MIHAYTHSDYVSQEWGNGGQSKTLVVDCSVFLLLIVLPSQTYKYLLHPLDVHSHTHRYIFVSQLFKSGWQSMLLDESSLFSLNVWCFGHSASVAFLSFFSFKMLIDYVESLKSKT